MRPPMLSMLATKCASTPSTMAPTPTAPATSGRRKTRGTSTKRGTRRSIHAVHSAASSRRSTLLSSNTRSNAVDKLHALHPHRHRHDALVRRGEQRDVPELPPRGEIRALRNTPRGARLGRAELH